jgi:hypothetical protein
VAERVVKASLAVRSPWHLALLHGWAPDGAGRDRALDETIWVVDEHLDTGARDTQLAGAVLGRVTRIDLVQKERSAVDLEPGDAAKIPRRYMDL